MLDLLLQEHKRLLDERRRVAYDIEQKIAAIGQLLTLYGRAGAVEPTSPTPLASALASMHTDGVSQPTTAYNYLKAVGKSLHMDKLCEALVAGGVYKNQEGDLRTKAAKLKKSLTSALIRDGRFERVGKNTFRAKLTDEMVVK